MAASPSRSSPRMTLLTIPTELRLEIYTLVFSGLTFPSTKRLEEPPLLQVCELIRNESVDIFNKRMTALLDEHEAILVALRSEMETLDNILEGNPTIANWDKLEDATAKWYEERGAFEWHSVLVEDMRDSLREEGFRV